jgi:large subunit ribosomal protein L20
MRVKTTVASRQSKKKWFRRAKGAYATKKNRWRMVIQHLEMSMRHMYRGRKQKKRDFRGTWIQRINAAVRLFDPAFTYSRLINGLAKAGIEVDRKVLADLAVHEPEAFNAIAGQAKAALV